MNNNSNTNKNIMEKTECQSCAHHRFKQCNATVCEPIKYISNPMTEDDILTSTLIAFRSGQYDLKETIVLIKNLYRL